MAGKDPFILRFLDFGPEFEQVTVPFGTRMLVGRDTARLPDVDLRLPHGTVPSRGPLFRNDRDGWSVTDLRSTSGTHIDGRSIPTEVPTSIAVGNVIRIGGIRCVVEASEEVEGTVHLRIGNGLADRHTLRPLGGMARFTLYPGSRYSAGGVTFTNEDGRCIPRHHDEDPPRRSSVEPGDYVICGNTIVFVHDREPPVQHLSIAEWRGALESPYRDERWTAAHMIGALGPEHADSRVALDAALEDDDPIVRRWAEWAQARAAAGSRYLTLDERRHPTSRRIEIPANTTRQLRGYADSVDDVQFDELGVASPASVQLDNVDGSLHIHDPSGDYTVHVAERPIGLDRATLETGDRVRIGSAFFFVNEEPPRPLHDDVDRWMASLLDPSIDTRWTAARVLDRWLAPASEENATSKRVRATLDAASNQPHAAVQRWCKRVLECPDDSIFLRVEHQNGTPFQRGPFEFRRRQYLTLGRVSPPAHIAFGYGPMPKLMAAIGSDCSGYYVEDLKSFGGAMVNGSRTVGRTAIHMGDEISMGALTFFVHAGLPAPPSDDVEHWVAVLEHSPYADERWTAAQRLSRLNVELHRMQVFEALNRAAQDPEPVVRRWAMRTTRALR